MNETKMEVFSIIAVTIMIILLICFVIIVFVVSGMFAIFMSSPPEPIIKYGEFPFKLVYELNGETKVIEDVIICEHVGVKSSGAGKSNEWKQYLKSSGEIGDEIILLDLRKCIDNNSLNRTMLDLHFYYGEAKYYMGEATRDSIAQGLNYISYCYQSEFGDTYRDAISAETAWEKYKIRLISWECAPPIENEFR